MIPGLGNTDGDAANKTSRPAIKDDFGELLLKKFEEPERISESAVSRSSTDLGSAVGSFIKQVNAKQQEAADIRTAFLAGEPVNLHQTMIASQEASVSFTLMVEMRNKVLEAYQELMRIQI